MSNYIHWLRSKIGSRKTMVAYATALIRDEAGRVLFQRRADFGDAWWGLPGGVVEIGESFADCAKREAFEETGYHVEPARLIGLYCAPEFDVRYPNGDEVQQFTVALECHLAGGADQIEVSEVVEQRFFEPLQFSKRLPPWYAAMVRDFVARDLCRNNGAYFDPPVINHANTYMPELRALVGHDPLIVMGASAIIFDDNGRVLLGLRGDNHLWGSPAGQMELGETPAGTAMRETFEEVGLRVRVTQLVGVWTGANAMNTYPDGNQVQIAGARFRADVIGGELRPDGYETLDVQWFEVSDLPPMVPRHTVALQVALAHPEGGQFS